MIHSINHRHNKLSIKSQRKLVYLDVTIIERFCTIWCRCVLFLTKKKRHQTNTSSTRPPKILTKSNVEALVEPFTIKVYRKVAATSTGSALIIYSQVSVHQEIRGNTAILTKHLIQSLAHTRWYAARMIAFTAPATEILFPLHWKKFSVVGTVSTALTTILFGWFSFGWIL